ncbi:hypothetical protein FB382_004370 [Nocardioides ginsengisegetis]|uniref:Uncharacterized protein n=1 Tax=Nocardioides ginsengisegetis TaxID=661491 RepID=A0A7W3J3P2_9ACTN|nr:hypothetical protein [Nocardioides ginsengisegetis]MBA8805595.1 hypothetical protein [Nocardioides ginsengisegetis]MBA8806019.1 hypothetical protein [Nocardioides ginsengisegetis]
MPDAKRTKRSREEYEDLIAKAMRVGDMGWVEFLTTRFDRDYPAGGDQ